MINTLIGWPSAAETVIPRASATTRPAASMCRNIECSFPRQGSDAARTDHTGVDWSKLAIQSSANLPLHAGLPLLIQPADGYLAITRRAEPTSTDLRQERSNLMRAVIQRVTQAQVRIGGEIVGQIGRGLLVLLGVTHSDTLEQAPWLADKDLGQ